MQSINPTQTLKRMDRISTFTKAFFLKITKMVWEFNGATIVSLSASSSTTPTFHTPKPFFCIVMEISILAQCSITKEMEEECSFNLKQSSTNTIDMKLRKDMMTMRALWLANGRMIS